MNKIAGTLFLLFIGLFFTYFAVKANTDLVEGRHVIYMDEQITFDGVSKILNSNGVKEVLVNSVLGDKRYGRILWYTSSFFSAIPRYFYGVRGQIVATRMLDFLALSTAFLILSFSFLESQLLRALGFILLMSLPTSPYYSTMPKPEPLQLIFLSLFLLQSKRKSFSFDYHWIFLGLAFGAKISSLTLIPFSIIVALFANKEYGLTDKFPWRKPLIAGFSFLAGFVISEPVFIPAVRSLSLRPIYGYVRATFLSTGQGADNASITCLSWIGRILKGYTNIPENLLLVSFLCVGLLLFINIKELAAKFSKSAKLNLAPVELPDQKVSTKNSDYSTIINEHSELIIIMSGIMLFFPIMLFVKRLWVIYLHNGVSIFLIGVLALAEKSIRTRKSTSRFHPHLIIPVLLITLITFQAIFFLAPTATKEYIRLSHRTQTKEHKEQIIEYNYAVNFLQKSADILGRRLFVCYNPSLYVPQSTKQYEIYRYWGGFSSWDGVWDKSWKKKLPDIVFFNHNQYKFFAEHASVDKSSNWFEVSEKTKKSFEIHVSSVGTDCQCPDKRCYNLLHLGSKAVIYVRSDLYDKLSALNVR